MYTKPEQMVEWVEPFGPNDEPAFIRIARSTAIAQQKHSALLGGYVYNNDEEALIDFIVVHWASVVEGNNFVKV